MAMKVTFYDEEGGLIMVPYDYITNTTIPDKAKDEISEY